VLYLNRHKELCGTRVCCTISDLAADVNTGLLGVGSAGTAKHSTMTKILFIP